MFKKFNPQMYVHNIWEVTPGHLHEKCIKGVIIDLDNTIVPWKSMDMPTGTSQWVRDMREDGLAVCVVSNAKTKRVHELMEILDVPAIPKANKPLSKSFRRAMSMMGTDISNTAVIGDQLFTDIWGGNRLGLYTILVIPMSKREFIGTKIVRQFEKLVLYRLKRKKALDSRK